MTAKDEIEKLRKERDEYKKKYEDACAALVKAVQSSQPIYVPYIQAAQPVCANPYPVWIGGEITYGIPVAAGNSLPSHTNNVMPSNRRFQ